ncbi:OmpW/AlkL family protein [Herminiimonas fonticola]|uniref:Outer membrane protein n=1 Tax=Herminiimonas fonticola TaxID=303380 RepID=A0A4R6GFP7_9BURK|nr:OmpW family outer membrane protein [Herminiimonas fonticola]RBA24545.1 Outer membrane protein W [Herminiimonas fonticola]TDN93662.1 outer membrane protein [Herminiimonas fonticola]
MKTPLPFRVLSKIAALSLAAAFSLPAAAQSAGDNIVNVGWFHLYTDDSSQTLMRTFPGSAPFAGSSASVGNADTLGIAFTHFFTDNFALTADLGIPPKFHLDGGGSLAGLGEIGTAKQWSPALIAKWYFGDKTSKLRPFVGLGATRVWYSDVQLSRSLQNQVTVPFGVVGGSASAELSSSWAPVYNVGLTYNIDAKWSLGFSLAYIPLDTDAYITGRNSAGTVVSRFQTNLTLDPYVTFLSLGYKF